MKFSFAKLSFFAEHVHRDFFMRANERSDVPLA